MPALHAPRRLSMAFLVVVLSLVLFPLAGRAAVIHWDVKGTFTDRSLLRGGFSFDSISGEISNISLRTDAWDYRNAVGSYDRSIRQVEFLDDSQLTAPASSRSDLHFLTLSLFNPGRLVPRVNIAFNELIIDPLAPAGNVVLLRGDSGNYAGLAVPIPEPETYGLLLAGLLTLGVARRGRSRKAGRGSAVRAAG